MWFVRENNLVCIGCKLAGSPIQAARPQLLRCTGFGRRYLEAVDRVAVLALDRGIPRADLDHRIVGLLGAAGILATERVHKSSAKATGYCALEFWGRQSGEIVALLPFGTTGKSTDLIVLTVSSGCRILSHVHTCPRKY